MLFFCIVASLMISGSLYILINKFGYKILMAILGLLYKALDFVLLK